MGPIDLLANMFETATELASGDGFAASAASDVDPLSGPGMTTIVVVAKPDNQKLKEIQEIINK